MIILGNRLIFGIIKKIIVTVLTFVYKVLSLFNLQVTALVLLVGLVLFVTGVLERSAAALIIFCFALVLSVLGAVWFTVKRLLGLSGGKKRKGVEIIKSKGVKTDDIPPAAPAPERARPAYAEEDAPRQVSETADTAQAAPAASTESIPAYPRYFAVRQNKDYIMAEYADRYELYLKDRYGLKKIRIDYKNGENAR